MEQKAKIAKAALNATALCGRSRLGVWPLCGLKHVATHQNSASIYVQNNTYLNGQGSSLIYNICNKCTGLCW